MRRSVRRVLIVFGALLAVVVVLAIVVVVALRTPWGGRQLARLAERQAERAIAADVSIGSIQGRLLSAPVIRDLSITRQGRPVLQAERVEVQYRAADLIGGAVAVDEITLVKPTITLAKDGEGLALFNLFRTRRGAENASPRPFALEHVRIEDGNVILGPDVRDVTGVDLPDRVRDVDGRLGVARDRNGLRLHIERLSFTAADPPLTVQQMTGEIRYSDGKVALGAIELRTDGSVLSIDGSIEPSVPEGS